MCRCLCVCVCVVYMCAITHVYVHACVPEYFVIIMFSQVEMGVKGRSVLHSLRLPEFDIIKGCPVDYMHCVLLGVTRKLLSLWFDPKHHRNEWYVNYCILVHIIIVILV